MSALRERILRVAPPAAVDRVRRARTTLRRRRLETGISKRGSTRHEGPLVTIVVPTRNPGRRIEDLLERLASHTTYRSFEIVVFDNGSEAPIVGDSGDASFPLHIVSSPVNRSFSDACNEAAGRARGELLLFLNDDVAPINAGWLGAMVDQVLADDDVAAVGAVLLYPASAKQPLTVQHRGIVFGWRGTMPGGINVAGGDPLAVPTGSLEVPAATAACLMVPRNRFEAVGGFSHGYVYGWEDVDLCLKLRAAGGSIQLCGDAFLYHQEFASQDTWSDTWRTANYRANGQRFAERWAPTVSRRIRLDHLEGASQWVADGPRRMVIVGRGHDDWIEPLRTEMTTRGWQVERLGADDAVPSGVALLVVTDSAFEHPDRVVADVKVAWLIEGADTWASGPGFDDYDIVATARRSDFDSLEARIAPTVVDLPAAAGGEFARASAESTHGYDYVVTSDASERSVLELLAVDPGEEVRFVGRGWNEPRARRYWRGEVPEDELPSVLAGARAAVDASPDGSAVSPMVYRALAAGTLVITRNRAATRERFGGGLPTFASRQDLRDALDRVLGDPQGSTAAAARLQARVLAEDLVSHRADALLSAAHRVAALPRIAWRTGPPRPDDVERWGDTHLARHVAAALRRKGFISKVTPLRLWDQPAHQDVDIVVHLHGLTPYVPKPAHFNVLWIISHPELVTARMCNRFDLVLVASHSFADELRPQVSVPVMPWLQATNAELFRPSGQERSIDLLFVGNSRRQDRPIVRWALEAGLPLTVYGGDWNGLVPPEVVAGEFVPNHELPDLYSRAKVILNDHWPEMAEHGFVSNRVFDALACGTPVISDEVVGLRDVIADGVVTVDGPEALAAACAQLTSDPAHIAEAGEAGRSAVAAKHSTDHRAEQLVAILESIRAGHGKLSAILDRCRRAS